jgi:hypothetical protein
MEMRNGKWEMRLEGAREVLAGAFQAAGYLALTLGAAWALYQYVP